jgi:hypothetical protein
MFRRRLLLLYPRAWRERYGEEFLAMIGAEALTLSRLVDIIRGAIDARLSPEVRHMTNQACVRHSSEVTPRDGLIGAGVMIGLSLLFTMLIFATARIGLPQVSLALKDVGFFVPFTASMPFWLMKGAPRKGQWMIVGTALFILIAGSVISHAR